MAKIRIRKANKKDVAEILELLYDLERPKPETNHEKAKFQKMVLTYVSDKDKTILVAEQNSQIVGMTSLVFLSRLNRTKLELYIPELVVSSGYRRSGIGKSLIDSCIRTAKKKKCYRIRLESGNQRKESHQFYKKIGFEQSALTYTMKIK